MKTKIVRTHQQIISAAVSLILEKGFDNVSIDAICKQISISRSTFYNHFNSKDQLISEYFQHLIEYTPAQIAWIYDAPTAYERTVRVQLAYLLRSKNTEKIPLYSIHLKTMLTSPCKENLLTMDASRALLTPLIHQAQEAGEILNTASPEHLCETALILNMGNLFTWAVADSSFDRISSHIRSLEILFNVRNDLRGLDRLYNLSLPEFSVE